MNNPVFIAGTGRCGSTWLQEFLNLNPAITIHGQLPNLPVSEVKSWYDRLVRAGEWGQRANQDVPHHYAECQREPIRLGFRSMLTRFYSNDLAIPHRRWGLKLLHVSADPASVAFLDELWPDCQWVTCIRHPFTTFESLKNTFCSDLRFVDFLNEWCQIAEFALKRGHFIQIDQLSWISEAGRKSVMRHLMQYLQVPIFNAQLDFVGKMPVVHKVKPDDQRTFKLGEPAKQRALEDERFAELFSFFGYREKQ